MALRGIEAAKTMLMERYKATSWAGTEERRREQGVCFPPSRPPVTTPRYTIPQNTACRIRNLIKGGRWFEYITVRETGFERFESYRDLHYVFRLEGWLMRVHRSLVVHREDSYPHHSRASKDGDGRHDTL